MRAMLLVLVIGCGLFNEHPKVGLREATCKSAVLLSHLGNNEGLVERVLDGRLSAEDAIYFVGGLPEDVEALKAALGACETVKAPPPDAGNKVL